MKKTFFLFAFVALRFSVFAQNVEKKVTAATEFLRQDLISGNKINLENIVSDNLSFRHLAVKFRIKKNL